MDLVRVQAAGHGKHRTHDSRSLGGEDVENQEGKEREMGGTRGKGGAQVGVRGRREWRTEKMTDLMDAEQNDMSR